jgi:hypothetical protein
VTGRVPAQKRYLCCRKNLNIHESRGRWHKMPVGGIAITDAPVYIRARGAG